MSSTAIAREQRPTIARLRATSAGIKYRDRHVVCEQTIRHEHVPCTAANAAILATQHAPPIHPTSVADMILCACSCLADGPPLQDRWG